MMPLRSGVENDVMPIILQCRMVGCQTLFHCSLASTLQHSNV